MASVLSYSCINALDRLNLLPPSCSKQGTTSLPQMHVRLEKGIFVPNYKVVVGTTVAGDSIGNNGSRSPHTMGIGCEISCFCLLLFCQNENLALLSLYTFSGKCVYSSIFQLCQKNIIVNFIIQKLKIEHTFLKKYTN